MVIYFLEIESSYRNNTGFPANVHYRQASVIVVYLSLNSVCVRVCFRLNYYVFTS